MTKIAAEVLIKLGISAAQVESARSAGSIRYAVSEAYSGVDNAFSALLIHRKVEPDFNHKRKLDQVRKTAEELAPAAKTDWERVEQIYKLWLDARYKKIDLSPTDSLDITRVCGRLQEAIFERVGADVGLSAREVEEEVYRSMWGGRWRRADEHISNVHDYWQDRLERAGEEGYGHRLGNKLANPSNFSSTLILADDEVTNAILNEDDELGHFIGHMYHDFLRLVVLMQNTRAARGVSVDQAPNFMLGLRFSYRGQSVEEMAEDYANIFGGAIPKEAFRAALESTKGQVGSEKQDEKEVG